MNTHDIELPAEFRSGNDIPVTQATIKRERMEEILRDAIEADRKRRGELVAWRWRRPIENECGEVVGWSSWIVRDHLSCLRSWPHEALYTAHDAAQQPAEPLKGQTGKTVLQSNQSLNEPVKMPSDEEVLKIAIDSGLAFRDSTGDVVCAWREDADISEYLVENARALLARYRNSDIGQSAEQLDYASAAKACRSVGANSFAECFERAAQHKAAKCDGNHGGLSCANPEHWNDSSD